MACSSFSSLLLLLTICSDFGVVSGTGFTKADQSLEYLLHRTSGSRPPEADPNVDCMWRKLALRYARTLQPGLDNAHLGMIHDALELDKLCGDRFVKSVVATKGNSNALSLSSASQIFVDANAGSDSNIGSIEQPLKSIQAGVMACRDRPRPCELLLREGTYRLESTINFIEKDSGLRVVSYKGEAAIVSGGRQVSGLHWKPDASRPGVFVASLGKYVKYLEGGVRALLHDGKRATLARYPNANAELDLFPKGYITEATEWAKPRFQKEVCDPNRPCGKSKTVTIATIDAWHGMFQNWTVGIGGNCEKYDPPQSPWCSSDFYALRQFPEMHSRAPSGIEYLGHLPNAPYKHPEGSIIHAWRPGHWYTWMFEVSKESVPPRKVEAWEVYDGVNAIYGQVSCPKCNGDGVRYLGSFQTQEACWSACNSTIGCRGWTWHSAKFDHAWSLQCYGLYTMRWAARSDIGVISGRGPHLEGASFNFSAGGNQGGEGSDTAGEWFIEGVMEELDEKNEFYFDSSTNLLYFYFNGSGSPEPNVVVPALATLFDFSGSQDKPVQNVTLEGLVFTETRPTFMEARGNPSGGDWSLERSGALRLEGTESLAIRNCTFVRLDSNAISINGYNRFATIERNEFVWLGQNAIASWGRANQNDGRNGQQPRHTSVINNFCHEIGHLQKQSSFYFQAETALTTIEGNIVFNIPRAGINFNDGFGGGNEIKHNLLFNTCRESGDHGAFNSWDRLPYITTIRDGTPSTIPKRNDVHNNFIVANYAADGGCLDNDDGSAYYDIHHNFCMYGGHKANFDGHSKRSFFNIHVHPQVYGTKCIDEEGQGMSTGTSGPHGLPPPGYAEEYTDNICILPAPGNPYMVSAGSVEDRTNFEKGLVLRNNTIYIPGGDAGAVVSVGGKHMSFAQFQSIGFDPTSRVIAGAPTIAQIVAWAEPLLQLETRESHVFI